MSADGHHTVTRRTTVHLRQRPRLAVLCAVTVASLLALPLVWHHLAGRGIVGTFRFADFGVYWSTANDWLDGQAIYDIEDPFGNYLYPPVYLLAFVPFASWFGWPVAAEAWIVLSVGLLWLGLNALVWTYVPSLRTAERFALAAGSLVLLVGFHPILYGIRLGQASIIVAAIVTAAVVAMERDRPDRRWLAVVSGALTAVGGTVKLFYAPVGAHLLLDRVRLVAAVVAGVLLAAASIAVFGLETNLDYLHVLAWGEDWGTDPAHPSWGWIPGYYRPLYGLTDLHPLLALIARLGVVLGIIAIALWVRDAGADREVFALGIVAIPLVGPQVSTHDLAVVLPAIVILAAVEVRRDGHVWLPVLALLLFHWQAYVTFGVANVPDWIPFSAAIIDASPWLQPGLYGNVALMALAVHRALEHRPPRWYHRNRSQSG